MNLTPGKWIAFQTPSQKANVTQSPQEHWSVGIEHHDAMCHGVAQNGGYMLFSGIGTKADAFAMAAAPALLEALEVLMRARDEGDVASWSSVWDSAEVAISLAKGEAK